MVVIYVQIKNYKNKNEPFYNFLVNNPIIFERKLNYINTYYNYKIVELH